MVDIENFRKRRAAEYQKHKKKIIAKQQERKKIDIQYKLSHRYRNLLVKAVRRKYTSKAEISKLLTIDYPTFKTYVESLFSDGMTWDNYGGRDGKGWEMDHIKPLRDFDLTNEEHVKECFHYTNIRPVWALENKKRNRIDGVKNPYRVN